MATDEQIFEVIYHNYFKRTLNVIRKYIHDSDESLDVCQEVFINIWSKRPLWHNINDIKSYILKSAKNKAIEVFNHNKAEEKYRLLKHQRMGYKHYNPYIDMIENEYSFHLQLLISKLPPLQRKVFSCIKEDNLTHEETGASLDMSKDAVEKNMCRALSYLRKKLTPLLKP